MSGDVFTICSEQYSSVCVDVCVDVCVVICVCVCVCVPVCQSAYRTVPEHIPRPDYADHPEGYCLLLFMSTCIKTVKKHTLCYV